MGEELALLNQKAHEIHLRATLTRMDPRVNMIRSRVNASLHEFTTR